MGKLSVECLCNLLIHQLMSVRLIVLFIFAVSVNTFAQNKVEGIVRDSNTKMALPYANIGIVNKNIGTVSDSIGRFRLEISAGNINDTLKVSYVGYKPKVWRVSQVIEFLAAQPVIDLEETAIKLPHLTIVDKKLKTVDLGNSTRSKKFRGGFTNSELGNELGVVIKIKKPTMLMTFNTTVVANTSDSMKFRLNIYDVRKGLPNDRILQEQIVFPIETKAGNFSLDLSSYKIVMTDDFFVSLELIENYGRPKTGSVLFSAGFLGNPLLVRQTSQGSWKKYSAISVGFNLTGHQ
jgi:hypothetical protein